MVQKIHTWVVIGGPFSLHQRSFLQKKKLSVLSIYIVVLACHYWYGEHRYSGDGPRFGIHPCHCHRTVSEDNLIGLSLVPIHFSFFNKMKGTSPQITV